MGSESATRKYLHEGKWKRFSTISLMTKVQILTDTWPRKHISFIMKKKE
jgi:hypothetical protein